MADSRRWYDKDPILKEALELLKMQTDVNKAEAADYILKLQEQVAADVIEHLYETISKYQGKGNRWYDNDPVMMKAIEMLRLSPPKLQRIAALKILLSLEQKSAEKESEEE